MASLSFLNPKQGLLFDRSFKGFGRSIKSAGSVGFAGALTFGVPFAAWEASRAKRGEAGSTFAGSLAGSTLSTIPGAFLGGPLGAMASSALMAGPISRNVKGTLDYLRVLPRYARGLPFLMGDRQYTDTQTAYTMRQRAAQDISTSLLNARQYLGREAAFLHS